MALKDTVTSSLLLTGLLLLTALQLPVVQSIGVCYGLIGDNLPQRQYVVDLYKFNNLGAMRLYGPDQQALQALRGSNIELILDVPKDKLESIASNAGTASQWVQDNIRNYYPDVRFKYIAVGNEVEPEEPAARFVLPAMQNIQNALASAGLQPQIKVSTAVKSSLVTGFPPANGRFTSSFINPIISFLASNGSPLLANIYPYFSYIYNPRDIPLPYALFTSPGTVVTDSISGLNYQNLFDALVDTMHAALAKVGGSNVPIVVSESGWPSAGSSVATPENAATYHRNLIRHVQGGTPRKPQPLETFIFAMFDENLKKGDEVERHFGIFNSNGSPKYNGVP
uniref:Glucan endo-1,3-beta-D-glucosidase n=1 Tax=Kalanchoe fedtschenkoi TaxID=63787 RepID=A0A7N1A976_KALFE